ncbi:MAG: hypothetical protein DME43_03590 [Verrucomicrobia bacterium]|nr:MAG: hypothetical protein DME43_03590 [Verrucomicrobiota bacterium]PYK73386.1 MAG: hypothetical protein DME44_01400 [Verrucomicrobiota bacterium]
MIFLQMVNGLRHYPVASALAQTFPHPVIFKRNSAAFRAYKSRGQRPSLQQGAAARRPNRLFKNGN